MLRKAVLEGNGPIPQQEEFGSSQPTLEDALRDIRQEWKEQLDKIRGYVMQRLASQEQDARQPRLAMESDGPANIKTCKRTEGAATTAVQAMRGDGFSARRVEPGPNTSSTSFSVMAEPPALPCRDDVVVESGDAAPKSCLPSLEVRSSTAAGG